MAQSLTTTGIEVLLPRLRRYARAAVGEESRADDCVATALESALATTAPSGLSTRALYRALYHELRRTPAVPDVRGRGDDAEWVARRIHDLDETAKHALLLRHLERLDVADAAFVMGLGKAAFEQRLQTALHSLRRESHAAVLIIEDNAILASHIAQVVTSLGLDVTAVARTAEEAVAAARERRPDLVLADVELDGPRSGIDAIEAIRGETRMPTIFVTGFPERIDDAELRTPDCLLSKPFDDGLLRSAMSRALHGGCAADAV